MYCLKCGGETPNQQLFCPGCLDAMQEYPIRADAPVHLPKREVNAAPKKSKQKEIPPEQQILKLKTKVRRMGLLICLLALALAAVLAVLFFRFFNPGALQFLTAPGCMLLNFM